MIRFKPTITLNPLDSLEFLIDGFPLPLALADHLELRVWGWFTLIRLGDLRILTFSNAAEQLTQDYEVQWDTAAFATLNALCTSLERWTREMEAQQRRIHWRVEPFLAFKAGLGASLERMIAAVLQGANPNAKMRDFLERQAPDLDLQRFLAVQVALNDPERTVQENNLRVLEQDLYHATMIIRYDRLPAGSTSHYH